MKPFLETVNYSSCNEDANSEYRALEISSKDSVLCITGSGARPLDLLVKSPGEVTAIDFNPRQKYLLDLKMAALKVLEYEEFLQFIGVTFSKERESTYHGLRRLLSPEARSFWDGESSMLKKGVLYQGRWEKYFRMVSAQLRLIHPFLIRKIFEYPSLEEQKARLNREWDTPLWRLFLKCSSFRFVWKCFLADPGFYAFVPEDFSINQCLYDSFYNSFSNVKISESAFAALLFKGRYDAGGPLPEHLKRENYRTVKDGAVNIRAVSSSLTEHLAACGKNRYQKYSLSDFSSYTGLEDYKKIWDGIARISKSGARICERKYLVKRQIPEGVRDKVIILGELEKELSRDDSSMFYTFNIAEVR